MGPSPDFGDHGEPDSGLIGYFTELDLGAESVERNKSGFVAPISIYWRETLAFYQGNA